VPVRAWSIWTLQRQFLAYVLIVDALAVAVIAASAISSSIDRSDLMWFGVLCVASAAHQEVTKRLERMRELATEGTVYTHLHSIWTFAALLLVPLPLVAALVILTYVHMWLRVSRRITPHRWVFSAATVVLASAVGAAVLGDSGFPEGWAGAASIAFAATARWAVNTALVVSFLLLTPGTTPRQAVGNPADEVTEFAALGLGASVAAFLTFDPPLALALLVPILATHRGLLMAQFESAARQDAKTGVLTAVIWHELAGKQLERARRQQLPVGLLIVDLDGLKAINDRYGSEAGDRVLRAVASLLRAEVREDDLVGRLGGEEFAVLAPGSGYQGLTELADRLGQSVRAMTVSLHDAGEGDTVIRGLTVTIGGAAYPVHGGTVEALMTAADNALFVAKTDGPGATRIVRSSGPRNIHSTGSGLT